MPGERWRLPRNKLLETKKKKSRQDKATTPILKGYRNENSLGGNGVFRTWQVPIDMGDIRIGIWNHVTPVLGVIVQRWWCQVWKEPFGKGVGQNQIQVFIKALNVNSRLDLALPTFVGLYLDDTAVSGPDLVHLVLNQLILQTFPKTGLVLAGVGGGLLAPEKDGCKSGRDLPLQIAVFIKSVVGHR